MGWIDTVACLTDCLSILEVSNESGPHERGGTDSKHFAQSPES